jgi:protein Mpv17
MLMRQILFGAGDILAQHAVERRPAKEHDYGRTGRFAAFGGIIAGPFLVTW